MDAAPTLPHDEVKRILMGNDLEITLRNEKPRIYYKCSSFDDNLMSGDFWHMIVINHNRKFSKRQILNKLFEVIGDSEFYPVAYTECNSGDYFLLRKCNQAIEKLFKKNLQLNFNDETVNLIVKFQVAQFKLGQIYPSKRIAKALSERFANMMTIDGISNVLNLDNFAAHHEFEFVSLDFSNLPTLQLLFSTLASLQSDKNLLQDVNGIRLSNNKIRCFRLICSLRSAKFILIDLRQNNISFVRDLEGLKSILFSEICLDGNPVIESKSFFREMASMFPSLKKIDNRTVTLPSKAQRICPFVLKAPLETFDVNLGIQSILKYKFTSDWHSLTICHGGKYSQNEILDALFDAIAPNDLYPCYYKSDSDRDSFLMRNCFDPIEALILKKLTLQMRDERSIPLILQMHVADGKATDILPTALIQDHIVERFNAANNALDLSRFDDSEKLSDFVCRLSVPRVLTNILSFAAKKFATNVETLNLSGNNLKSVRGMHSLIWMKGLKELDLSENQIASVNDIVAIPKASITELWLHGNPICDSYQNGFAYATAIKEILPNLERLDGKDLNLFSLCSERKNFLLSLDAYDLVECFVEFYFHNFDSVHRFNVMRAIYHSHAIFTMSSNFLGISDSSTKNICAYFEKSRNFARRVNTNPMQNVYFGAHDIATVLSSFGSTEHDFTSFKIDVTNYTGDRAVIVVNGVFKQISKFLNESDLILGFSRTFIIGKSADKTGMFQHSKEFKILNDISLFYRPSAVQVENAFRFQSKEGESSEANDSIEIVTNEDKLGLITILNDLTGLSSVWCRKILERTKWDFREALESFMELLKDNKIPADALKC